MTASELRSVTVQATIARSPVLFALPDGRVCECVAWHTSNPAKGVDGKPTGIPTLVLELGEPIGALPTADSKTEAQLAER